MEYAEHVDAGRFDIERSPEAEEAAALDATQATMIDLAESERLLVMNIKRALEKLDAGTYGVSERSAEPIGFPRLRAVPWATLSAADQEEVEQRIRRGERQ